MTNSTEGKNERRFATEGSTERTPAERPALLSTLLTLVTYIIFDVIPFLVFDVIPFLVFDVNIFLLFDTLIDVNIIHFLTLIFLTLGPHLKSFFCYT